MSSPKAASNPADPSTPDHYGPSQTALLLLDFHSTFIQQAGGSDAPAALETAAKMRTWAKSQRIHVIHCLVDTNATPFPTCKDAERLVAVITALKSNGGAEEDARLHEGGSDGDIIFTRTPGFVSALKSPGLDDYLQQKNIKSLVLAGLSTSGCVMRTAFAATDAEYVVSVISDGCADRSDGVHDMVMEKILNGRAHVTTAIEFQDAFTKAVDAK
ncbi:MAG: hypothetical protein M1822_009631 [Bathelium mastoideum]|nr:MAG: hypothetical protein M1822_009631 [Bathelium mastoideum]